MESPVKLCMDQVQEMVTSFGDNLRLHRVMINFENILTKSEYSGGSNIEHVGILSGSKLFGWRMAWFSNGWDLFGRHLLFL